jgi:hypothetical protein
MIWGILGLVRERREAPYHLGSYLLPGTFIRASATGLTVVPTQHVRFQLVRVMTRNRRTGRVSQSRSKLRVWTDGVDRGEFDCLNDRHAEQMVGTSERAFAALAEGMTRGDYSAAAGNPFFGIRPEHLVPSRSVPTPYRHRLYRFRQAAYLLPSLVLGWMLLWSFLLALKLPMYVHRWTNRAVHDEPEATPKVTDFAESARKRYPDTTVPAFLGELMRQAESSSATVCVKVKMPSVADFTAASAGLSKPPYTRAAAWELESNLRGRLSNALRRLRHPIVAHDNGFEMTTVDVGAEDTRKGACIEIAIAAAATDDRVPQGPNGVPLVALRKTITMRGEDGKVHATRVVEPAAANKQVVAKLRDGKPDPAWVHMQAFTADAEMTAAAINEVLFGPKK